MNEIKLTKFTIWNKWIQNSYLTNKIMRQTIFTKTFPANRPLGLSDIYYNVLRTPNVTQFKTMLEIYKSILGLCPSRFRWRPWINTEIKSLHFTYTSINLSINGIYIVDMCSEYFSIFQYLANECVPIGNWGICMFQ